MIEKARKQVDELPATYVHTTTQAMPIDQERSRGAIRLDFRVWEGHVISWSIGIACVWLEQ